MFARVVTMQFKPELVEDGIRIFKKELLPSAKKLKELKESYLLVDRQLGKIMGFTVWESEKAMQEYATTFNRWLSESGQKFGPTQAVDVYEVEGAEV